MISTELKEKYQHLLALLKSCGSAAIAFSGGVDSTFLLFAAKQALGTDMLAVTASSGSFPEREFREAEAFCKAHDIPQLICRTRELEIPGFRENPKDRCYLCKQEIFGNLQRLAKEHGMKEVAEGSNLDDNGDYRPGMIAIRELGIRSPLREAGLSKAEIRSLSQEFGLPTWNKPSFACLASRFVYGETITKEKLHMVEQAEEFLRQKGFSQYRVRIHDRLARIELLPGDIPRFMEAGLYEEAASHLRSLGFTYVTLDLLGYRSGSMNETLTEEEYRYGTSTP